MPKWDISGLLIILMEPIFCQLNILTNRCKGM
jgi:hypothetical protein